ncbi:MAG: ATP-binding protein [Deltaproteobacteria bacterium]|nr:ATP-binding protein [Deltaproteobacteria bacterium]
MSHAPFSRYLPYFASRTIEVAGVPTAFMFNIDGTVFVGFEVAGVDVYAADNARVNRIHGVVQQVLNVLPDQGYAQWEWVTGDSFDDVINDYAARGSPTAPAILQELRRRRVDFLRRDPGVRRGRLFLYVGVKRVLPELGINASAGLVEMLKGLLPGARRGPPLAREEVVRALTEIKETGTRMGELFAQVGVKMRALDEPSLLARIHTALNPRTARRVGVQIVEEREALAALTSKKSHALYRALTVREQLPLSDLVWEMDCFQLDQPKVLHRALSLQRWPAAIGPDFLFPVQFSTTVPLRLVSTMEATHRLATEETLMRKRNIAQALSGGGHVRDHRAQIALAESEALLDKLVTHDQRLFFSSVYAVISADTQEELNQSTSELINAFGSVGGVLTIEENRQHLGFLNTLPGHGATAPERRSFQRTTENVACVVPLFQPSTGDASRQVLYHTRHGGLRSIGYTTKTATRPNTNTLVLGGSGSGKSFNVAEIFEQACLAEGGPVSIVDVQGPQVSNYRVLCDVFDGTYTSLAGDADIAFNPFMPMRALCARDEAGNIVRGDNGAPAFDQDKLRYLSQLVCVMAVPNIATHPQEELCYQVARQCILRAYMQRLRDQSAEPPLLGDVVEQLQRYEPKEPEYKPLARDMYLQLDTWVKNPLRARLLNRQSRYASTSRLQVFDFYGLEKDEKLASVLLLSVAFNIWSTIYGYPKEVTKFVLFDECWKLLTHPVAAKIVAELYRTGRKWGASTWAITQNLNDFLQSPIRSDLISNAATVILNQHATDHDRVIDTLELSARHAALFKSLTFKAGAYSELLYVEQAAKEAAVLRLVPSPFELWLNTSSATDTGFRARVQSRLGLSALQAIRLCSELFPGGAPKDAERGLQHALASVKEKPRAREDTPQTLAP